jgi:hypothetical protein
MDDAKVVPVPDGNAKMPPKIVKVASGILKYMAENDELEEELVKEETDFSIQYVLDILESTNKYIPYTGALVL